MLQRQFKILYYDLVCLQFQYHFGPFLEEYKLFNCTCLLQSISLHTNTSPEISSRCGVTEAWSIFRHFREETLTVNRGKKGKSQKLTILPKSLDCKRLLGSFFCQNIPLLHDWLMAFSFGKQVCKETEILTECKFALLILAKLQQRPNPT